MGPRKLQFSADWDRTSVHIDREKNEVSITLHGVNYSIEGGPSVRNGTFGFDFSLAEGVSQVKGLVYVTSGNYPSVVVEVLDTSGASPIFVVGLR
jgi:hypothetical protein